MRILTLIAALLGMAAFAAAMFVDTDYETRLALAGAGLGAFALSVIVAITPGMWS